MSSKANILLVGAGAVGAVAAYNLEIGGKATITAVLRLNYEVVKHHGFTLQSISHGFVDGWKPTKVTNVIPRASSDVAPFDYIVVTSKNVADIHPTIAERISPAVTETHTTIVLMQNGLNIEKSLIAKFPNNSVLSGISMIGAKQIKPGHVIHDHPDLLIISDFDNPNIPTEQSVLAAKKFVELYKESGKAECYYNQDTGYVRWRKLVYDASFNAACAITGMDSGRMKLYSFPIESLIRPLMQELVVIAKEAGHNLPDGYIQELIDDTSVADLFVPTMLQDVQKGDLTEFENIVGEPLREAERLGVSTPYLKMAYAVLKIMQQRTKEVKGLVDLPTMPLS